MKCVFFLVANWSKYIIHYNTKCSSFGNSLGCYFVAGLYTKGLVFIDVPIADDDYIVGKK